MLRGSVAFVVSVIACTREPAPQAPHHSQAYTQLEGRLPAAFEALGRLRESLRAAGDDCAQVARTLRTFASVHSETLRAIGELFDRLDEREREQFEYSHQEDHERFSDLFALATCPGNADVSAALQLAGLRRDGSRWID